MYKFSKSLHNFSILSKFFKIVVKFFHNLHQVPHYFFKMLSKFSHDFHKISCKDIYQIFLNLKIELKFHYNVLIIKKNLQLFKFLPKFLAVFFEICFTISSKFPNKFHMKFSKIFQIFREILQIFRKFFSQNTMEKIIHWVNRNLFLQIWKTCFY